MTYEDEIVLQFTKSMNTCGDWEMMRKYSENKIVYEIGTYAGISAIVFSRYAQHITTIDNYTGTEFGYIDMSEHLKYYKNITVINSDSVAYASKIDDERIDTLFIDGDHRYEGVARDYSAWQNKIIKHGVLMFHDVDETHDGVYGFIKKHMNTQGDNPKYMLLDWKPKYETSIRAYERMY